ncbi:MAG: FAD-dependent oxidoreductase [Ktedonobacteraceae bacterium]|nr:FAD-dependent oxidoreductase [Ktedonobacteraceae bacterium]
MQQKDVDILVIGGGVVGCAILRELARFDASIALLERAPDICEGTSKANSAIVHTGFDASPSTLEARLLAEARALWPDVVEKLHIPYLQTGALMIATSQEELSTLEQGIIPRAARNGVTLQRLTRADILERAPYVNPRVMGGVLIEGESIIDPFWTTRAYCENAMQNGAAVFTNQAVTSLVLSDKRVQVRTSGGLIFNAALVVNAAGLWSDEIARMVGDDSSRSRHARASSLLWKRITVSHRSCYPYPARSRKAFWLRQ